MTRGLTHERGTFDERPFCLRCRRAMASFGSRRFRCKGCGAACMKQTTAARTPAAIYDVRPYCVSCRLMMYKSSDRFTCRKCGVSCAADKPPRLMQVDDRPTCPACRRPMTLAGWKVKNESARRFRCHRCLNSLRRQRQADALRLMSSIQDRLPRYLTPDEREDARQSVVLDLLSGEITPDELTPARLRSYAARAVGMTRNPYKFVSLSQPTADRCEFGDHLAA